jgi:cytochrome c-type biogenesis protein CcmH
VKRLGCALALLIIGSPLLADSPMADVELAYTQLPDAKQEKAAKTLMESVRCLVCQGQSVADSDAQLAGDMRALIRRKISEGQSPDQIKAWLIERYGDFVTYDPPFSWTTAPLWLAPIAFLLFGIFLARGRFRRKAR